jgi:hypothetical protein
MRNLLHVPGGSIATELVQDGEYYQDAWPMRFTNRATKRRIKAIKLQFKEIMCMFKQRRADFIITIACNRDSGVEELLKLYWLCGSDAADYFFEKFGPPVFCLDVVSR